MGRSGKQLIIVVLQAAIRTNHYQNDNRSIDSTTWDEAFVTTKNSSTIATTTTIGNNFSCSNYYEGTNPSNSVDKNYFFTLLTPLAILASVLILLFVVSFRYRKNAHISTKKEKQHSQNDTLKIQASPFEEVLVSVDTTKAPGSLELRTIAQDV